MEVYVFQGVSKANQTPLELEFVPHVTESGVGEESFNETSNPNNQPPTSTFPSIPTDGPSETSSTPFEAQSSTVPPRSPSIVPPSSIVPLPYLSTVSLPSDVPPPSTFTVPPPSYVPSYDYPIIDNDPTDDEVEDKSGSEGNTSEDTEVDSDVH
ncbi:allergen Asp f 7 homolog [Solanum pennellii]|uniref:Allergen Asp f 7 homolog n=1 Tax=Solanum pennellii TaxID=28526 RepID=A0ABM1H081_SOLPN|nr:allergen Asp f 7 homolog [Solanum pennellii]